MNQQQTFKAWAEDLQEKIIQRQKSRGIKASGASAESLRIEYLPGGKGFRLYGAGYFFFQEYGRGPSKAEGASQGISLRDRIRAWIDDKAIIPVDITKDSLAYLISRKIHEEGTLLFKGEAQKVGLQESINEMIKKYKPEVARRAALAWKSEFVKGLRLS
jgi:hypothetical protein